MKHRSRVRLIGVLHPKTRKNGRYISTFIFDDKLLVVEVLKNERDSIFTSCTTVINSSTFDCIAWRWYCPNLSWSDSFFSLFRWGVGLFFYPQPRHTSTLLFWKFVIFFWWRPTRHFNNWNFHFKIHRTSKKYFRVFYTYLHEFRYHNTVRRSIFQVKQLNVACALYCVIPSFFLRSTALLFRASFFRADYIFIACSKSPFVRVLSLSEFCLKKKSILFA